MSPPIKRPRNFTFRVFVAALNVINSGSLNPSQGSPPILLNSAYTVQELRSAERSQIPGRLVVSSIYGYLLLLFGYTRSYRL
ncbi:hypothetical protein BDZ89DRAFT_812322 [Hymenopellis radicata]|nr:hypothetical protein BDZ89DRAFT_812322 [Hymenopellis radicata]